MKVGMLTRDRSPEVEIRDAGAQGTQLVFSASSETPVERFFGTEILSHADSAIRLQRVSGGAVPLLWNHNWDEPIGMVDGAQLADKRLRLAATLFDTPKAREVAAMVRGGLRNVSIGYRIHALQEAGQGPGRTFTATDWEPLEASVVSVPADASVGIGRAAPQTQWDVEVRQAAVTTTTQEFRETREVREVVETRTQSTAASAAQPEGSAVSTATTAPAGQAADVHVIDNAAEERLRIKTLQTLARTHKIDDETRDGWIDGGVTAEQAAQYVLDVLAERATKSVKDNPAHLGLSQRELQQFSLTRAIRASVEKNWTKAGLEAEASRAVAQRLGRTAGEHTFFVPLDVQYAQRDLIVGTNTMGGFLVGTNVMSFIELLRNRSVVMRMGATEMPGLQGSVAIPKQTGAATAYWFANETGTATESQQVFGQLTMTPKTVGAYTEISRQLLLQSTPNAEQLVNADLARVIGLAVDSAALAGPGTAGQPTGIVATTGVGTANPTAGTNVAYADMIRFQSVVAGSNAFLPGFGYVTTPTIAGILMGKPRFTNSDTPIWGGNILDGQVVGAQAMSSLQVGSGSMLAGDFSQVVIGSWGVLEIETNPYAAFQSGIVGVRALYTCDVGVRYAAAFALGTGITG
jgi:HK97 family phage major capsid protein/HK97 family phage prohead protease